MVAKAKKKKLQRSFREKHNFNKRITALFVLFLIVGGGLIARLYYVQIVRGEEYSAFAKGFYANEEDRPTPRGDIYFQDKAGEQRYLVATNKELSLIYANPRELEDEENVLRAIAEIVEIDPREYEIILNRLKNKNSAYALIARELEQAEAEKIKQLDIRGVYINNELVRTYPAGNLGANILGFLGFSGDERMGQYGIEEYYNNLLGGKGEAGLSSYKLVTFGNTEPADLELTIDYGIQFMVERKLQELYTALDADSASAVFMNPRTGEILAMAQYPSFDLNNYSEVENISVFKNDITQSVFEFGSVFKPITMAAAIDGGALTPQTVYNDTGSVRIGGYTINNSDGKSHDLQTMTEVLEKSLNTGVIFVQQQLGKKKFREYLEDFQLDKATGVDLPGEARNNIENIKNTNRDINFATASFGQGISFSPLRFLTSLSAIANNGVIMKPYLVKRIIQEGQIQEQKPQEMASPISSLSASRVTAMMVGVVENGFGKKAAVPGYKIAGKTGTAQVPNLNGPGYSDKTIHSFIGFAPAYNPVFIGMIKVDNPQGINFSADSVAPAWGEIAAFILQYYKIPPQ